MKEAGYGKEDICTDLFVDIAALALFSDRDYCDLLIYRGGYNVFSPAMIDGIISKLRAYEDRTLRREVQDSPEEMLKLVEKYSHCG